MPHNPLPLADCRLLIVEDNFLVAEAIKEAVEAAGARVVGPYPSMIDALEHLGELTAIDGAILDIGLDGVDSYPLAQALQTTRIPFMFLTGVSQGHLPEQFARTPHMEKPFDERELIRMLVDIGVNSN